MTSPLDDLLDLSLGAAFARDDGTSENLPLPMPAQIGRYTIKSLLGQGGLGSVYLGRDEELGRDVAIKVLHEVHASNTELMRRFREEARTCSQLQHPGIVSVHELGTTEDGCIYYTMRVVAGETLQRLLADGASAGPDRRRFLAILERAAQAVAFAHSHEIVHGDLTPANVMVGEFGEVQVLDWGLSRRVDARDGGVGVAVGRAIGTPAYMAPEQAQGAQPGFDRRTDVFGLGAILCEILTGSPPYVGDSVYQVHQRAAQGAIDDARTRLQAVAGDRELVELAMACLEPEPGLRPTGAAAVAQALAAHLQAMDDRAHRFELEAVEQRTAALAARRARRTTSVLAMFLVMAVLLASVSWSWWRGEREQRRARANQRVVAAMTTARQLQDQAVDLHGWRKALTALETAKEAAAAADVDRELSTATRRMQDEITAEVAGAELDEATRHLLIEGRWHIGDDRSVREIDADYRDAFARCGIDVDAPDQEAAANLLRSHRLHPELASALHWWGLQRRRSRFPTAAAWRSLLELADRCDLDARRTELRRAFLADDFVHLREIAAMSATIELPPNSIDLLGQFLVAGGDRDEAIGLYRLAHLRHPDDYDLCHDLATLLTTEVPPPIAEITGLMTVGAALRPSSPHALVDLAMVLIDARRLDAARPIVAHALRLDPSYGRSWYCTSLVRERDGDFDGAQAALRECAKLDPGGAQPILSMARLLERAGRGDEALAACRQAVAAGPRWGEGLFTLGRMLFERVDLVEAIEVLEQAVPVARERGPACYLLGRTLSFAGLHARAVQALREADQFLPDNPHVTLHLGIALAASGQLDEAVELLAIAYERGKALDDWHYPPSLVDQARVLRDLQPELVAFLHTAQLSDPAHAEMLGDLAMSKGEPRAAMHLFAAACRWRPEIEQNLADRRGRAAARVAFLPDSKAADGAERTRCAAEAIRLLEISLQRWRDGVQAKAIPPQQLRKALSVWALAPELSATRRPPWPDWLPEADRTAWRALWADVDRLLAAR